MTEVTLFKNSNGATTIVLPDPKLTKVSFSNGRFFTEDKNLENFLTQLAEKHEFGIYIDPQEPTHDTQYTNPLDAWKAGERAKIEAEVRAQLIKEANSPAPINAGNSVSTQQDFVSSIATTADNAMLGKPPTEEAKEIQQEQQKDIQVGASTASLAEKLRAAQNK